MGPERPSPSRPRGSAARRLQPAPTPALIVREQRRRRRILLAVGGLLVFSMSPLFGHHVPTGIDGVLAGKDHLWALCLVALHTILEPVHLLFHALFAAGLAYALWDRFHAWIALHRAIRPLYGTVPAAGDDFGRAAADVGLAPDALRIVDGLPSPAFTAGWIRPRIFVARALRDLLDDDQLRAVLAHEAAHLARRDPLRLSALRFLACTLFWVPGLRGLLRNLAEEAEIQADDAAARERPLALASALLVLARWPRALRDHALAPAFADPDLLERRIRRLAGESLAPPVRVGRRTLVAGFLALALAWASGAIMAHPLPGDLPHHHEHCDDARRFALSHLFCRGVPPTALPQDHCPILASR